MQKTVVFYPRRPIVAKLKKQPFASLTFDPKKLYTKFHQNQFTRFVLITLHMKPIKILVAVKCFKFKNVTNGGSLAQAIDFCEN